jgi:two-component system, LytTR family, response regulator LytT
LHCQKFKTNSMKLVIIEDEKITAKDLKKTILAIAPGIDVTAVLHTTEDAIAYFTQHQDTDLIFSDIQLGDGLCFEIFKKINNQVPIIFCTAYNNYFAEAFQATGIDYVLKPFTKNAIEKALTKYQTLKKKLSVNQHMYKDLLGLLETKFTVKKSAVIVRHRDKIIPLNAASIALLYIDNGCTYAYTFNEEKFVINDSMEELENDFTPLFFRANRQYLVNRKAIKDASHFFNRKIVVNLTVGYKGQVVVGKLKTTSFINWLSQA